MEQLKALNIRMHDLYSQIGIPVENYSMGPCLTERNSHELREGRLAKQTNYDLAHGHLTAFPQTAGLGWC